MDEEKVIVVQDLENKDVADENKENDECKHCDNHPCVSEELKPMLLSIMEAYAGIKSNKQIRFLMYSDSTKFIFGTGLGEGVRKRLPLCTQSLIRSLAPDKRYTGFKEAKAEGGE